MLFLILLRAYMDIREAAHTTRNLARSLRVIVKDGK